MGFHFPVFIAKHFSVKVGKTTDALLFEISCGKTNRQTEAKPYPAK